MIYMHWVPTGQTVNKEFYVEVLRKFGMPSVGRGQHSSNRVSGIFPRTMPPVHNSILVIDYLTKMGIKTVHQFPYSPYLAPCDFWLFPKLKDKLRGYRYETIEEIKEAVTKVIDTLTQEDFYVAFQKLLERYNKCIAAGGDYFEEDKSFMSVLSIKVPIRKKSGNLFNEPCMCERRYACVIEIKTSQFYLLGNNVPLVSLVAYIFSLAYRY